MHWRRNDVRNINLLFILYKVNTGVLYERLNSLVKTLIGLNLASPPKTRSAHYVKSQKRLMKNKSTHHLFVHFKPASDSLTRDRVFAEISELDIPAKLLRLCKITFNYSFAFAKAGMDLSEPFNTLRNCRQNDP